jgi:hypothetical protein
VSARHELARDIFIADNSNAKDPAAEWQDAPASVKDYTYAIANGLIAAGYVKADHDEYGMDHKHSDLEFTDEDGEPWTDEDDFRAYADEYGSSMQMVRRSVTAWEPLV